MSDTRHHDDDDVADIRRELWLLYAGLKEGEVDPDVAYPMTEVLDSLADLIRLEGELRRQQAAEAGKRDAERTT